MAKKVLCVILLVVSLVCAFTSCGDDNNENSTHTHSYGEWETTKAATCIEGGIKERYCSCGEKQTTTIDVIEHSYSNWIVSKEETCTENGIKEKFCSICEKKETEIIIASHNYINGICSKCSDSLVEIKMPTTPLTLSKKSAGYGIKMTSVQITSIRIDVSANKDGTYNVRIYYSGEKTYDCDGNSSTMSCSFIYKLYDSEGYLITSGDARVSDLSVGEKFKDKYFTLYNLNSTESYTLSLTDAD